MVIWFWMLVGKHQSVEGAVEKGELQQEVRFVFFHIPLFFPGRFEIFGLEHSVALVVIFLHIQQHFFTRIDLFFIR